jgi:asparagine synthase (glutamine-hydrolysing)
MNGEIYNFLRLRDSLIHSGIALRTRNDAEVLVELIAQRGVPKTLEAIEGMFAFAAVDTGTDELWLARDRFGEKPLFVSRRDSQFGFCSELTPLVRTHGCNRPSAKGVISILRYGYPWPGSTAVEGISELQPAQWMRRDARGQESSGFYWQPTRSIDEEAGSTERCGKKILELLNNSVQERLVSDVPIGLFLSGGIDSGAVACAARELGSNLEAVTVGFSQEKYDERPLARMTAKHLQINLHEEIGTTDGFSPELVDELVSHYGQPFADTSAVPTRVVSQVARKHFKVVLSGDGGDELFCGYPSSGRTVTFTRWGGGSVGGKLSSLAERFFGASGRFESLNRGFKLNASLSQGLFAHTMDGMFTDEQILALVDGGPWEKQGSELLETTREECRAEWRSTNDPILALSLHQVRTTLPQDMLMKVDRMSMAASLEVRAPFLDSRLANYALSLPAHVKMRGTLGKHVLRESLRGHLPNPVLDAPKRGFSLPLSKWLDQSFWRELDREMNAYQQDSTAEMNAAALMRQLKADSAYCRKSESYRAFHRAWLVYTFFRWRRALYSSMPDPPAKREEDRAFRVCDA